MPARGHRVDDLKYCSIPFFFAALMLLSPRSWFSYCVLEKSKMCNDLNNKEWGRVTNDDPAHGQMVLQ